MEPATRKTIEQWKNKTLHDGDIPFEKAAVSAGKENQLFEVNKVGDVEWAICKPGENNPASFSYAAVVSIADPMETGNLVIDTEERPEGIPVTRVERWASYKCSYTYVFDTSRDHGLYTLQTMMDNHMETIPEFETADRLPRRLWQSGSYANGRGQFWMRVPMFIRIREGQQKQAPPDTVHEWVKVADTRSMWYRANPSPPRVHELVDEELKPIGECNPPKLVRGDIVAISFSIIYVVGRKDWYPTYFLTRLVRVGSVDNIVRSREGDDTSRTGDEHAGLASVFRPRSEMDVLNEPPSQVEGGSRKRPRGETVPARADAGSSYVLIDWPDSDEERRASRIRTELATNAPSCGRSEEHGEDVDRLRPRAEPNADGVSDGTPSSVSSVTNSSGSSSDTWSVSAGTRSGGADAAVEIDEQDDLKGKKNADTTTRRRTRGGR